METPQPIIDIPHTTQRVIDYYYSYGTKQQLNTKAIPSVANIRNLVPAMIREWYNFESGRNYYGGNASFLEVMVTLDPAQQRKWFHDSVFKYIIERIDSWNLPPTDNHHEDRLYVYSTSRFGGWQDPSSRRPFNPVAWLGTRDNAIQNPYIAITRRNYDTDIQETLNDSLERGCLVQKNDMSTLLGRRNY
jgi:hypothetical protein